MQIIDYKPQPHSPKQETRKTILEALTATLIFVLPAILLFILAAN